MASAAEIGVRVRQARDRLGVTQRELSTLTGLSESALSRIETGIRQLASHELRSIADALGVATGELLGYSGPSARLAVAARVARTSQPEALSGAVSRLAELLEVDDLLTRVAGPSVSAPRPKVDLPTRRNARMQGLELADQVRNGLGLGLAPLPDLPALLEERFGIDVDMRPLPDKVHGLATAGDGFAYVLVSTKDTWGRQRFTMCHELCHLLVDDLDALVIDAPAELGGRTGTDETRANAFAAHLLAPDDAIRQWLGGRPVDDRLVMGLVHWFGTSLDAMCNRLVDLGLLDGEDQRRLVTTGFGRLSLQAGLADQLEESHARQGVTRAPARLRARAIRALEAGLVGVGPVADLLGREPAELRAELAVPTPPSRRSRSTDELAQLV
jgi:Zn-dependent peptidase ImmA (M78 family)/transcriptional regulator with XRE-family HTH domain